MKRVVPDEGARPDTRHQVILGDELAARPRQDFDDLEGAVAERYRRAARPKLAPAEIDFPWPVRVDQILRCCGHRGRCTVVENTLLLQLLGASFDRS